VRRYHPTTKMYDPNATDQAGWDISRTNNLPTSVLVTVQCVNESYTGSGATSEPRNRSVSTQTEREFARPRTYCLPYWELATDVRPLESAPQEVEDQTQYIEEPEWTAHPQKEVNIVTRTFYNKQFLQSEQGKEPQAENVVEVDLEPDTTAYVEPITVQPSKDRSVTSNVTVHYPIDALLCRTCDQILPTVGAFRDHLAKKHAIKTFITKCSRCGKAGEFHSIACHYPKCQGERRTRPTGEHQCSECILSFTSLSGLSQHERHKHPALRNVKRVKEALRAKDKPGRRLYTWTAEEEEKLKELERRFAGYRHINKEIAVFLPGKTNKQISDKRRTLLAKSHNISTVEELAEDLVEPIQDPETMDPVELEIMPGVTPRRPAGTPKHREIDDNLTQAEELLMTRSNPDDKALGIGIMESITELLTEKNKEKRKRRSGKGKKQNDKATRKSGNNTGAKQRWARQKAIFKATQLLYKNNRRQLARQIMGTPTLLSCPLSLAELEANFKGKLSTSNNKANIAKYAGYGGREDDGSLLKPVEVEEVTTAIRGIEEHSAAGPDGNKLEDIKNIHEEDETRIPRLFTLWLTSRTIPSVMKQSRTVLIPKSEDPEQLKNIDNWRPITIGPMLLRLFTKIIAKRLSKTVTINPRQKGFIAATPGCNENIAILQNIINGAKANRKDLAIVFVDLAKAFDSVGHKHLIKALQRVRLPKAFVELINNMYTNNTTVVEGHGSSTGQIKIEKGVKQGDPLSPILFNIAMDPLICSLEANKVTTTLPLVLHLSVGHR